MAEGRTDLADRSSIDPDEVAKFGALAGGWWDPEGDFRPLHRLNPTRLAFIRDHACEHFTRDTTAAQPLTGLKVLDIGCGGGLLSEPLARLGAQVTGIDATSRATITSQAIVNAAAKALAQGATR